jgi:hypothetical protein
VEKARRSSGRMGRIVDMLFERRGQVRRGFGWQRNVEFGGVPSERVGRVYEVGVGQYLPTKERVRRASLSAMAGTTRLCDNSINTTSFSRSWEGVS